MVFTRLILLLLISNYCYAYVDTKLPVLQTKQALNNLNYFTSDGKYTYYSKRNGVFYFSSNFEITEVIKGEQGAHYNVFASEANKNLLISMDNNFHNYLSLRHRKTLYLIQIGKTTPIQFGEGVYPQLHLDDSWISYYDPYDRVIKFTDSLTRNLGFDIKLVNKKDVYMTPKNIMLTTDIVLFLDKNEKGVPGILSYDRKNKSSEILLKADSHLSHLDFCLAGESLFIGEVSRVGAEENTIIYQYNAKTLKRVKEIYRSSKPDLLKLQCRTEQNKAFFIKNTSTSKNVKRYELVSLDGKSGKVEILTDLETVTNFLFLDKLLLVPFRGDYYVVQGDSDFFTKDRLKSNEGQGN